MAYFRVNPTDTQSSGGAVTIAAASTGNRARFIAIGYSNASATVQTLRIWDGPAGTGTIRVEVSLASGSGAYTMITNQAGHSTYPKVWFTSGNAISADLAATGDVRLYGEVVREV